MFDPAVMASLPQKLCTGCSHPMSHLDGHDKCLQCIGLAHDMYSCEVCTALDSATRNIRRSLVDAAKRYGAYPDNWRQRLYPDVPVSTEVDVSTQIIPVVSVATVDLTGPSVSVESVPASKKTAGKAKQSRTAKPVAQKRSASVLSGTSSLSAEEAADPVLQELLQNYRDAKMSVGSVSVHSLESQKKSKPKQSKAKKQKTVASDQQKTVDSDQTLLKVPVSQEAPVVQALPVLSDLSDLFTPTLEVDIQPSGVVDPPVPPPAPVTQGSLIEGRLAALELFMEKMSSSMIQVNESLAKMSSQTVMPPHMQVVHPPIQQTQRIQPAVAVSGFPLADSSLLSQKEDRTSDDDTPFSQSELLTLGAKRQIWLSTLREIAPDLPHPPLPEAGPSSCLVGLSRQQQEVPTLLLPEVVQGLADRSKALKSQSKRRTPFKWVPKTVFCGAQADRSIFQQRSIS